MISNSRTRFYPRWRRSLKDPTQPLPIHRDYQEKQAEEGMQVWREGLDTTLGNALV